MGEKTSANGAINRFRGGIKLTKMFAKRLSSVNFVQGNVKKNVVMKNKENEYFQEEKELFKV